MPVEPSSATSSGRGQTDQVVGGPSLRLRAEEYTKYLLVLAGLSPWFPHRDSVSNAGGSG
jgi:hypothetical protein